MRKKDQKKKRPLSKADFQKEIFPLNGKQETLNALEELEARLDAQYVPLGPANIWSCNPVHLCDFHCGGGNLCDTHCTCDVVI